MKGDRSTSLPNGWAGLGTVADLRGLNTRCIRILAEIARAEGALDRSAIYRERDLWARMDERASERAGSCPVLLLNLNFEKPSWWKRVCVGQDCIPASCARPTLFTESQGAPLLREILTEVWRLGSSLPTVANLAFGMAPGVSAEISKLSVLAIDLKAASLYQILRPRWEQNALFWKQLLRASVGKDDEALSTVHLHCLQLLGSDFEQCHSG
jgi:hypothetical protein